MRILVVRLSALGDVAMCIPVVYSLARQYPRCHVTVLTRQSFTGLFINKPDNLSLIGADVRGRHKGFVGLIRLLRDLRKHRFDMVADLHNVLRSWIMDVAYSVKGVKVAMVDKDRRGRWQLLAHENKRESANFITRYADVFARLGFPVNVDFMSVFDGKLPPSPIEISDLSVGIAPFARYKTKTYPDEMMRGVVAELAIRGYTVYLFGGGKRETGILEDWQKGIKGCVSLAGKFSLEQEMAIMGRLGVMLTMDSSNQHIASLVGVKAVTVWGGTTPRCGFLGYNQSLDNAICLNLPCQPCSIAGSETCKSGDFACLRGISPSEITDKIIYLMKEK